MNNLLLCGKIKNEVDVEETTNGTPFARVLLEVEDSLAKDGEERRKDIFQVTVWRGMTDVVKSLVPETLVSMKCHLVSNNFKKDNGDIIYKSDIVAEKIYIY